MTQTSYSNSAIQEFARCPLAYFYNYEKHLRHNEDDTSQHHILFGTALHKALEILYTEDDMKKAKAAMLEYYPTQLDETDLAKTAANACFTLEKYWEHYNKDAEWEIAAVVEAREFTEDGFGVKPDLVVRDRNDNLLIVDHKSTGRYLNNDYFAQFNPNSQITQYIRWCKEKYGHCDGFIVNAIAFRYRQRAYKGEPAGFWCAFERMTFQRNDSQIARTCASTEEVIRDIERAGESGHWRASESYSACHFCTYHSLCTAGWSWEQDEELILSQYRRICDEAISQTEEHCQLSLGHNGEHSGEIQSVEVVEFQVEV